MTNSSLKLQKELDHRYLHKLTSPGVIADAL